LTVLSSLPLNRKSSANRGTACSASNSRQYIGYHHLFSSMETMGPCGDKKFCDENNSMMNILQEAFSIWQCVYFSITLETPG
jgi:hypothetical protein